MTPHQTSRTKALWSGAITVAVLAVALIVLGLFGPLRGKTPSSQIPAASNSPAATSQSLYQQALQAQASGDLTRTAELAQSALDADPNNTEAKALLETAAKAVASSATTPPLNSSTSTSAADPDKEFRTEYADLASLLPTRQPGFSFDYPVQLGRDITMSGNRVPSVKTITQIAWSVHDLKSATAARSFVTRTSKVLFPKNASLVTIHGTKAYFGTDGTRFATIAFARGRYAFEVLVTVSGAAPKTTKVVASEAANAFPESPLR